MKIIAHRGNLHGPNSTTENTLPTIEHALELGFEVEVDVWCLNGGLQMGHDNSQLTSYPNLRDYLEKNASSLWIHCKNIEALEYLVGIEALNVFGHSGDDYVLTSKRHIFCRPGVQPYQKNILVMPEMTPIYTEKQLLSCFGILTDYAVDAREGNFNRFTP